MLRRIQNRAAAKSAEARMAMTQFQLPGRIPDEQNSNSSKETDWEIALPANAQAVPDARRAALNACHQVGASEEDCFALDLALGEALANAVTHGVSHDPAVVNTPAIRLRLWRYRRNLIIEVSDRGPGFDPPAPPYAMPADLRATHGRGLPLMERLTDALLVSRGDAHTGGAITFLIKSLPND